MSFDVDDRVEIAVLWNGAPLTALGRRGVITGHIGQCVLVKWDHDPWDDIDSIHTDWLKKLTILDKIVEASS